MGEHHNSSTRLAGGSGRADAQASERSMGGTSRRKLTRDRARTLRSDLTDAEGLLWWKLKGRNPEGLRFRRQHPEPPYIIDFVERKARLAIEVDGATHGETHEIAYDACRTEYLEARGWTVIRVGNDDVFEELDATYQFIVLRALELRSAATSPSPPSTSLRSATSPRRRVER